MTEKYGNQIAAERSWMSQLGRDWGLQAEFGVSASPPVDKAQWNERLLHFLKKDCWITDEKKIRSVTDTIDYLVNRQPHVNARQIIKEALAKGGVKEVFINNGKNIVEGVALVKSAIDTRKREGLAAKAPKAAPPVLSL